MASTTARPVRVIAGVALIAVGALLGGECWAFALIGLVPLVAGALDVCPFTVLFGRPFSGKAVRAS